MFGLMFFLPNLRTDGHIVQEISGKRFRYLHRHASSFFG